MTRYNLCHALCSKTMNAAPRHNVPISSFIPKLRSPAACRYICRKLKPLNLRHTAVRVSEKQLMRVTPYVIASSTSIREFHKRDLASSAVGNCSTSRHAGLVPGHFCPYGLHDLHSSTAPGDFFLPSCPLEPISSSKEAYLSGLQTPHIG